MDHIFISYSHEDAEFAELLHQGLELCGHLVWRDVLDLRSGQILAKEIGIGIDTAGTFVPLISEHFDNSKWLHHELAQAITSNIPVVPIVFDGAKAPLTVSGLNKIRIPQVDGDVTAQDLFKIIKRLRQAIGGPLPEDFDEYDVSSSDDDWTEADGLRDALVGTRWTWCGNEDFTYDGKWIEFESGDRLKRSWRNDPAKWKVTQNGFVVYKPHVLKFDLNLGVFQAAVSNPDEPRPERSGRRVVPSK